MVFGCRGSVTIREKAEVGHMFIPFRYTSYKNSRLATVVSFFGSIFIVAGILVGVSFVAESVSGGSGSAADIGEGILVCVIFVGLGWLLTRWAKRIAEKKFEKEMGAARRIKPSASERRNIPGTTAAGYRMSPGAETASNVCSHCGNILGPDDVFCYKCGTKRGS